MNYYKTITKLIIVLSCWSKTVLSQNVGINSFSAIPDASAMLDIASTNKGLLIPRVALTNTTSTLPIVSPATSLLVYNTNLVADVLPGYYYWSGAKWLQLINDSATWNVIGNTGTNASTDFLGTTNAQDFVIKTNAIERMSFTTGGNVAIGGLPDPSASLSLNASNQGFLITRVDTASILSPALGLMTLRPADSCIYLYNGFNWQANGGVGKKCKCICSKTYINNQTFMYTGADQYFTIPISAKWMDIYAWGGSGAHTGGYSYAHFDLNSGAVSAGSTISIMVGDMTHNTYYGCGLDTAKCLYGFGGYSKKCANEGYSGAGLSGVFTGATTILETDAARALVIAGGSGTYSDNDCACAAYYGGPGTCGNEPLGGGMPTFRGVNGTDAGSGGGGGGYSGGVVMPFCTGTYANPARGGSGYYHPSATFGGVEFTSPTNDVSFNPPKGNDNCLFVYPSSYSGISHSGYCLVGAYGLVVLEWGD